MLVAVDDGNVIRVRGLRKTYGATVAIDGIDLVVDRGQVFALLGPNGAGKTSTVEILEGYRSRDGGAVEVLGVDPATAGPAWRARIGIVLQSTTAFEELTIAEIVHHLARFYPNPLPPDDVLELVGLETKRNARGGQLSGGQQRPRADLPRRAHHRSRSAGAPSPLVAGRKAHRPGCHRAAHHALPR